MRQWQTIALIISIAIGVSCLAAAEPADKGPLPQLGQFTIKGLDVRHNKIDQLISRFGFICITDPTVQRRPCRIEKELIVYLKRLPSNQSDIEHELTTLGAVCETKNMRLDCVYKRRVENSIGFAGAPEPETIVDEFFRIDFGIIKNEDSLEPFWIEITHNRRD